MEQKLHRHVHHHRAAYLCRLIGFNAVRGMVHSDKSKYYVVPNLDLLAEKRALFCNINTLEKEERIVRQKLTS
jgi:hypothetical protein